MTLARLVLKNITRRRGRFVFTLLGITIGIASFVTFLALGGNLKKEVNREAQALGANLIITPKGSCAFEQMSVLTGEQLPSNITMDEVARIKAIKGLTPVPVLTEKSAISNRPVSVQGVIPDEMRSFKRWDLGEGEYFTADGGNVAVVGVEAARQFKLQPGSSVTIRGEQVTVKGILKETGNRDDLTIFLPLPVAQRLFKVGERVSYVMARVDDLTRLDAYALTVRETVSLGVVSDKQMLKSVLSIVGTVNVTLQMIAAVAVLAAAFGIINTMMAATYERKREIGILQALGARQRTIFTAFMLESGFYGLLGGIAGLVAGLLFTALATPYIDQNAFTTFVKGSGSAGLLDPKIIVGTIIFSALVAVLAGLYPAWRAARLAPVEAISYE
jgi:putative ABC transport system permease protein